MNKKLKNFLRIFSTIFLDILAVIGGCTVGRYLSTVLPFFATIGVLIILGIYAVLLIKCCKDDCRLLQEENKTHE
jgi:hypothetical protein